MHVEVKKQIFRPPDEEGGKVGEAMAPIFSEIVLCQQCFPGNLSFFSVIHQGIQNFWPRHSRNLVGSTVFNLFKW